MLRELREAGQKLDRNLLLPSAVVDKALRAFEAHAERYDGSYADRLSASLAAVAGA